MRFRSDRRTVLSRAGWARRRAASSRPRGFERLESRCVLSTLDIVAGALAYNESFGGTPNEMSIASSGSYSGYYTIIDKYQTITLSQNAISAGWSGSGTNTVSGPGYSVSSIAITAANQQSTLYVDSIDAPAVATGFQAVNAGESLGGTPVTLQGIRQTLNVVNPGGLTSLTLDDSSDTTSRTWNVGASSVTGPAPAAISFNASQMSSLTLDGGSGGNPFFVTDTGPSTFLNSGPGSDVINVTGTTGSLTIDGQGSTGQFGGYFDQLVVTNGPGVAGAISVQGTSQRTMLTLDDSASSADRNARLGGGVLSGLTAQPLLFSPQALGGLILQGGSGADSLTVDFTESNPIPSSAGLNYDGGGGTNALALVGGTFSNEDVSTAGPGAGFISLDSSYIQFSNLSPIADTTSVDTYTLRTDTVAGGVINVINGPVVGGLPTTEINSGDTPPAFELVDLANKTNVVVRTQSDGQSGPGENFTVNNPVGGTGISNLSIIADSTDDQVTLTATPAGVATVVDLGYGNNTVNVAAAGLGAGGSTTITAGPGTNVLNVNAGGGAVTYTASSVSVSGHPPINFTGIGQVSVVQAADAPLSPVPTTLNGSAGLPFTNVIVGSFTDADPQGQVSNFSATIDWGDGSSSTAGIIAQPGGTNTPFTVTGSHTYTRGGLFAVTVKVTDSGNTDTATVGGVAFSISDSGGSTTSIMSTGDVASSTISAKGLPIPPVVEGTPLTAAVAAFRLNTPSSTDVFTANVNWGDGTSPSAGTVVRQADGSFLVYGTHTYAKESAPNQPYLVTVSIVDPRGVKTVVTTSATVLEDLVVRTAADSGPHSLRDVILDVNADGRGGTITFAIPGTGPHHITLLSPLPAINVPVVIDATTQPGFQGRPVVVLGGAHAGAEADGLTLAGGSSTVKGLVINAFAGAGIVIEGRGGDHIVGNLIGTDITGSMAVANGDGVDINNVGNNFIGGTSPADRNIISGNLVVGVRLSANGAAGNRVQGNYIGTNAAGNAAVPNYQGVLINGAPHNLIGGTAPGAGNVISGNASAGLQIFNDATVYNGRPQFNPPGVASGNVLQGNLIGTNAAGTGILANTQGIFINDAATNLIGGTTPAAANVISGNRSIGIQILGDNATHNAVLGNAIGTDRSHTLRLGNNVGVYLYASAGNVVDRSSSPTGNVIAYNPGGNVQVRTLEQGPAVQQAGLFPNTGPITAAYLVFTTYMDPLRAQSAGSYIVTTIRPNGLIGTRIPIAAVAYNDIYRTVAISFATPVPRNTTLRLTAIGTSPSGLTDQAGNFLAGDPAVPRQRTGSNFVATFVRGIRVRG